MARHAPYDEPRDGHAALRIVGVYALRTGPPRPLPLLLGRISAGSPSPTDDFIEEALELNDLLVRNPPATFMMRVAGHSMEQAGICDGDLLLVDRSLEARPGDIVIAYLNGELTVKHVERRGPTLALVAANEGFPPIEITEEMDFAVWGIVTHVIRSVR